MWDVEWNTFTRVIKEKNLRARSRVQLWLYSSKLASFSPYYTSWRLRVIERCRKDYWDFGKNKNASRINLRLTVADDTHEGGLKVLVLTYRRFTTNQQRRLPYYLWDHMLRLSIFIDASIIEIFNRKPEKRDWEDRSKTRFYPEPAVDRRIALGQITRLLELLRVFVLMGIWSMMLKSGE